MLYLGWNQPGRRAGLTRGGRKEPLLSSLKVPAAVSQTVMPPRTSTRNEDVKKQAETGMNSKGYNAVSSRHLRTRNMSTRLEEVDDFQRLPNGSDSSDEESERARAVDIVSTSFRPANAPGRRLSRPSRKPVGQARLARGNASPDSSVNRSPKRKTEDIAIAGSSKTDIFNTLHSKRNKKTKTYGASQNKPSSQSTAPKSTPDTMVTPKKSRQASSRVGLHQIVDSDEDFDTEFVRPEGSIVDDSTPESSFKAIALFTTPVRCKIETGKSRHSRGSPRSANKLTPFRTIKHDDILDSPDPAVSSPLDNATSLAQENTSASQFEVFKTFDVDEITEKAKEILDELDDLGVPAIKEPVTIDCKAGSSQAICPMCKQQVELDDLNAYGKMNTRTQEKFCRMHQRKSAEKIWTANHYPDIRWEEMQSRISSHHKFIRKLINGEDSYYRRRLGERVAEGKDRSWKKMTSSLTPGYYGSRGLQVITENIMQTFTPLLKKRTVKDRLMSARGFLGYVQAVLVPEVAVRLIMEDMTISLEEARVALKDSAAVGELLQEELRDVAKRIDDSEDDELAI